MIFWSLIPLTYGSNTINNPNHENVHDSVTIVAWLLEQIINVTMATYI